MTAAIPTGPVSHLLKALVSLEAFRKTHVSLFESLTPREREVLVMVAEGLSNPAIAKKLNVSRVTVQNHRANIRQKLHISTQLDYFRYALAYDLITL